MTLNYGLIVDLSNSVLPIAARKPERLPSFLNQREINLLLKSCDKRTVIGKRNYAILMLLSLLGIRAAEVTNISLSDIDWQNGLILIRGKGLRKSFFPMCQELGDCLVAYLLKARPKCSNMYFFVQSKSPHEKLQPHVISRIVRTSLEYSKLNPRKKGAHLLRHSLATNMLQKGASLQEIAMVLGHQSINTTAIYAKLDFNKLNELALPWPKNLKFGGVV